MNLQPPEIHGTLFGVDIIPRTKEKNGTDSPIVRLVVEDDEAWHRKDTSFDAYWLDDLIGVLQKAKEHLKR